MGLRPVEPASPERREAMYFVLRPAAALGSASFEDEDIAYYDGGDFGLHFDGSDVGVAELAIDAIAVAGPAEILISFYDRRRRRGRGHRRRI